MAEYNVSTVASEIKPPASTSIGDMLNIARGAQAYQQAQQVNPLLAEQQQAVTKSAQLKLAQEQSQIAGGALTGLENSPAYKAGDAAGIKKELDATEKWLKTVNPDLLKPGGAVDQAHQLIDQGDVEGYRNHLANIRRGLASNASQYEAGLQQFNTNAQGTPFLTNRAAGTVSAVNAPSGQNLTPTTAGVENFSKYQKDLTDRVGGGIQIDARINEAEQLMNQFKPGAGARAYADVAQRLQAIGAPQDLVDKVAGGDLSATQSFNKFIAQAVTSGIGQLQGNPTANMMNDYLKNNPDVTSDPRALKRFFEFAHKQNQMAYDEQQFLLDKSKSKTLNPDTHVAEAQQHIKDKYLGPQSKTQPKEKATYGTYTTKDGRKVPVVSYDGGKSWDYK